MMRLNQALKETIPVYSAILYRVMLTYYGLEFLVLQFDSKLIFNKKKKVFI